MHDGDYFFFAVSFLAVFLTAAFFFMPLPQPQLLVPHAIDRHLLLFSFGNMPRS
jgi:hypothetical protein